MVAPLHRLRRADGTELIRLDRPPVNALSWDLLADLANGVQELTLDTDLRAVVITGSDRFFAAGAEIQHVRDPEAGPRMRANFRRVLDGLGAIPRPVIAAISGYALGGGLELALACDLRMVADNAQLAVSEVTLGLSPGAGATQRLPRLVGPARAKELIWSGRHVGAEEALRIGLADRIVSAAVLLESALEWAADFGRGPVVAMGLSKHAVNASSDLPLDEGLDLEANLFEKALRTADAEIGVRHFLERGKGKGPFIGR